MDDLTNLSAYKKTWISANAGSGKTYALVKRVTALLLQGASPSSILCLTYTNAAACEMQSRLVARLQSLAQSDDAQLDAQLHELLDMPASIAQKTLARRLIFDVLDAAPSVGFFTLHGFCQRLLSAFPIEAGISPYFTLMDDQQQASVLEDAMQALLTRAITDASLADAIAVLQEHAGDERLQTLLKSSMKLRRMWENVWSNADDISPLKSSIFAHYHVQESSGLAHHIANIYDARHLNALRELIHGGFAGSKTDKEQAEKIAAWCETPTLEHWQTYCSVWLTDKGTLRKSPFTAKIAKNPQFAELIALEMARVESLIQMEANAAAAHIAWSFALLTFNLERSYAHIKAREHMLDYDDLLIKTRELLTDDTARAWVLYKLDYQIAHVLLDEAQDTSPEQWRIVRTLISELWQAELGEEKSLLVVGDLKQSIYSFQGAAPKLFTQMHINVAQTFTSYGLQLESEQLMVSRRSVPLVLVLVDKICTNPLVKNGLMVSSGYVSHIAHRQGQAGRIVCLAAEQKSEKEEFDKLAPQSAYRHKDSVQIRWVNRVADMIADWLSSGRILEARNRPICAGDILVLLRQREPIASALIHALQKRNVPVTGLDRLSLNSHLAVIDHLAFFEWCLHPYDDTSLAIALRSPLGGLSEQTLCDIAHSRNKQPLWDALCERLPTHRVITHFEHMRDIALNFSIPIALQRIHRLCGAREAYAERFGAEIYEVLDAFLGQAENYVQHKTPSLRGFISAMQNENTPMKRDNTEQVNAVRVMTVHGAKGLEAPVVICADALSVPNAGKEIILFTEHKNNTIPIIKMGKSSASYITQASVQTKLDDVAQEYMRLMYVALTRAEDELYIGGALTSGGKIDNDERNSWYDIVRRAMRQMDGCEENAQGDLHIRSHNSDNVAPHRDKVLYNDSVKKTAIPDWASSPAPSEPLANHIYSPSLLTGKTQQKYSLGNASQQDRGVVMHRALQWIALMRPQSLDVAEQWLASLAPHWTSSQIQDAAQSLWQLWRDESLAFLWGNNVKREVPIVGTININGAPRQFSGQIDALIVTPHERIVIDYKTSSLVPDSAAIPESYLLQMLAYKMLLVADGSGLPVRTALLYTTTPTLIFVDELLESLTFPLLDEAV